MAELGSVEVARDPEVRALRAANKRGTRELDSLKKALVIFDQPPCEHPPVHRSAGRRAPVRQLYQALRVAPAACYAWQRRQQVPVVEPAWQVAVREAFAQHSQRYGTRRIRAEVQEQGHAVGRWRIRRVLKAHGPRAQQPRSFVPRTSVSDPAVRAVPNRLLGQPALTAPNQV